jgi:hypothetical protein
VLRKDAGHRVTRDAFQHEASAAIDLDAAVERRRPNVEA